MKTETNKKCDACHGEIEGAYSMRSGYKFCAKCNQFPELSLSAAQQNHARRLREQVGSQSRLEPMPDEPDEEERTDE